MTPEMMVVVCLVAFFFGYAMVTISSRPSLPTLPPFPPNVISQPVAYLRNNVSSPEPMESTKYITQYLADADPITQADILYYALRKAAAWHADNDEDLHKVMKVWVRDVCIERYPGVKWQ